MCAFLARAFARLAMYPASVIMSYKLTVAALFEPLVAADHDDNAIHQSVPAMSLLY